MWMILDLSNNFNSKPRILLEGVRKERGRKKQRDKNRHRKIIEPKS
jgi:hypothetical protein